MNIMDFEKIIGYSFNKKDFLETALSHSSYANERNLQNNERLEFLGDSILSVVVSEYLFEHLKLDDEGKLTKYRASLVCEQSLADLAKDIELGKYIKLGKGEENTGGRKRASILSDAYEALIAAIYLDSDLETIRKWLLSHMMNKINDAMAGIMIVDFKSKLQEIVQAKGSGKIEYVIFKETGPDHNKHFHTNVMINGKVIGTGEGQTKKEAEQEAAKTALKE